VERRFVWQSHHARGGAGSPPASRLSAWTCGPPIVMETGAGEWGAGLSPRGHLSHAAGHSAAYWFKSLRWVSSVHSFKRIGVVRAVDFHRTLST